MFSFCVCVREYICVRGWIEVSLLVKIENLKILSNTQKEVKYFEEKLKMM